MKLKHLLLSALAVAMTVVGCKKDNGQNDKPYISVEPAEVTFEVGDTEPQVVAVSSNRDWKIEDVKETWLKVTKLSDTEAQVVANEVNTGKNRTATVYFRVAGQRASLSVTQKGEGGSVEPVVDGDGSKENPYNVAQATAVAKALAADAYTETAVYVKGTVVSLKEPEKTISQYGSITLYISDSGTEDGQLYIYGLKDVDGAKFTAADKFAAGDVVVLYGKLQNYKGNTPEMATGGQLVSVNGKEPEAPVLEETTATGVVIAVSKAGFLVSTENGIRYVFDSKVEPTVEVGDNVTVKGNEDTYNGVSEIVNYTVTVNSKDNTVTHPDAVEITSDNIATYEDLFSYVKTTGNLTINGSYCNIEVEGASVKASLSFAKNVDESLDGKNVDVEGYFVGYSGTGNAYFNIMYTKIAASAVQPEKPDQPVLDGKYFEKSSSAESLDGSYLIVYEKSATEAIAFNGQDAAANYVNATVSDKGIAYSDNLANSVVKISSVEGGYSIQLPTGKYISGVSTKNTITFGATAAVNEISYESGSFKIVSNQTIFTYNNATSNGNRFRYYKSATVSGHTDTYKYVQLYKLAE